MMGSVNFDFYGIEVFFDKEVVVWKNIWYCIIVLVLGFFLVKGMDGFNFVQCLGVIFIFMDSSFFLSGIFVLIG